MFLLALVIVCLNLSQAHSLPPDKKSAFHIIKTRSIDLNNAHGLSMESRLEKIVEPSGYRLELEPYIEDGIFKGHVRINVTWLKDSDEISIHCAHEIEISDSEVKAHFPGHHRSDTNEQQKIKVSKVSMDPKKPIATLYLEKKVPKGSTGFLELSFNGNMETEYTEAFFKSTYMTEEEVERWGTVPVMKILQRNVAATQLRPNNARRMFPCFDEPAYKTPFELSVVCPRSMLALGNTPVARIENITGEPDAVWVHFERTPPMSTFTLGLVIADLEQLNDTMYYKDDFGNDIQLRVWARSEYLPALEGVTEKVKRVFGEIAQLWGVPLPLKKLDIVALPSYQGVKPADNWGLIVFRESDLSSRGYLQLAQEISYQWLGAFTTPAWWSDAHINKALVGYLAAETAFKINDGSEMEGKWPMTVLYSLYYEFSKRYPHSRITGMKQETACTKIELLFRMFNYTLGRDTFKKGLKIFLESRKFKTFTGDDIWDALNTATIQDKKLRLHGVEAIAKSWIEKDRLPILSAERSYGSKTIRINQKVFLRERPHDVPDTDRMKWLAPIVIAREDNLSSFTNTAPIFWLETSGLEIPNMPENDQFVILNPEEIAPYVVNYDTRNWNLLSKYLRSSKRLTIPELSRAKLLHDAWNLAYAGELSFATAFNMTLFLREERNHLVWDPVFTMIDHIGRHICRCIQGKFHAFVRTLLTPLYQELSKEPEKEDEESSKKNLKSMTWHFLCQYGYKPCFKEARDHYAKWMEAKTPDEGNPIPNLYICPIFKYGSMKEWEFGLQRVINFPPSRKQSERTYLLKTLAGCPIEESKITRILNITILEGNGNFTETDLFLIFSMLTGNPQGYTTLFQFLDNNWEFLKEKFAQKTNLWDNLINAATSEFKTQEGLQMVNSFYIAHLGKFGSAEHIIEKNMKNIREEAEWSSENVPVIEEWLDWYLATTDVADDQSVDKSM